MYYNSRTVIDSMINSFHILEREHQQMSLFKDIFQIAIVLMLAGTIGQIRKILEIKNEKIRDTILNELDPLTNVSAIHRLGISYL